MNELEPEVSEIPETPPVENKHKQLVYSPDDALAYMNKRYALLEMPGQIAVISKNEIGYQKVDPFRLTMGNRFVDVMDEKGKRISIAPWWLTNKNRSSYKDVGFFAPPLDVPTRMLNLWTGFAVDAMEGDWSLMQKHIEYILANGDPVVDEYIIKWLAWTIQNPGLPSEVALVFRGLKGAGKGTLATELCKIFGPHATHVSRSDLFAGGRFNGHLDRCSLLFADEALWAGNKDHEGALKAMITEPDTMIERKGVDARKAPNTLSIIMASNNEWVVPTSVDERRFVVMDVSKEKLRNFEYFGNIKAEMNNGGREAMLYDLLNLDLGDWHPRLIVDTPAMIDQKERSLPFEQKWLLRILEEGVLPNSGQRGWATSEMLEADVQRTIGSRRNMHSLSKILKEIGCVNTKFSHRRGWQFPPLLQARVLWEQRHWKRDWHKIGEMEKDESGNEKIKDDDWA